MVRTWQARLGFTHGDENFPTQSQLFLGLGLLALLVGVLSFWYFGFARQSCLLDPLNEFHWSWNCLDIPTAYSQFFKRSLWCLVTVIVAVGLFACVRQFSISNHARKVATALLVLSGLSILFWVFRFWHNHQTWVYENETGAYGKAFCAKLGPNPSKDGTQSCLAWGLETRSSRPITTETYDLVQGELLNDKAFWVKRNGKYAYLDNSGKPMTEFIFDEASNFGQHIALVKQGNAFFYIDQQGQPVNDARFDEAVIASKQDEFFAVRKAALWGYVNARGQVSITPDFAEVKEPRLEADVIGFPVKKEGRWGLVDTSGKPSSSFEFESIDGVFKVDYLAIAACFSVERCGFIGIDGKLKDPRLFRAVTGPILKGSPGFAVESTGESRQISLDKN
jgi:hypothetical protein